MPNPEPVQFDPDDEQSYKFEPPVVKPKTLADAVIKQGTTRNALIARILLITFSIIFFGISLIIIKLYIIDLV
jgi:hypothetical protein